MEFEIIKLSSKGQVVIPAGLRKDLKEGDKLIMIRSNNKLILQKATALDEKFKEDIEFAKRIEAAYQRYEQGAFITKPANEFLEELEKC